MTAAIVEVPLRTVATSSSLIPNLANTMSRPSRILNPPKRYNATATFDFSLARDETYRLRWINEKLQQMDRPSLHEYKIAKRPFFNAVDLVSIHHGFISARQAKIIWSDIRKAKLPSQVQQHIVRRRQRFLQVINTVNSTLSHTTDLISLDIFDKFVLCHIPHVFAKDILAALVASPPSTPIGLVRDEPLFQSSSSPPPPLLPTQYASSDTENENENEYHYPWLPSTDETAKHNQLKEQLAGMRGNYVGRVDEHLFKFGKTTDIERRADENARHFANFTLLAAYPCANPEEAEKRFRRHPSIMQYRSRLGSQIEMIDLQNSSLLGHDLDAILLSIVNTVNQETMRELHALQQNQQEDQQDHQQDHQQTSSQEIERQQARLQNLSSIQDPFDDKMLNFLGNISDSHKLDVMKLKMNYYKDILEYMI